MGKQLKTISTLVFGLAFTGSLGKQTSAFGPTTQEASCELTPREVVENFVDMLFMQRLVRPAFEAWVVEDYIQHKPTLSNGREKVIGFLERIFER